jgi:ubiquinone/menaquinone biosynthesis C-methylase UbiE
MSNNIEMLSAPVNYDQIAPNYNERYHLNQLENVASTLRALIQNIGAEQILEVGCGTGRWLGELHPLARRVYGLDLSPGMLVQAQQRPEPLRLVCGQATKLPFPDRVFDLVYCVNALHHFQRPQIFITEARRLLRSGGGLAIIGMDPHTGRDKWYLYHYFEETYELDLNRFPSAGTIVDWMIAAGFERVERRPVERIVNAVLGRAILTDHFLQKHGTSQLALLTDETYAAGLRKIEAALQAAEARGETLTFAVDISLSMIMGQLPANPMLSGP